MSKEYIIYADESISKGDYFSNFYGGALIRAEDLTHVEQELQRVKTTHNLYGEIKWSKATSQYLDKYKAMMDTFFDLIQQGAIKFRLMFTQNCFVPAHLNAEQHANEYFLLYYQFIKNAFGLRYANATNRPLKIRIYLDKLPDTRAKVARFRTFLVNLNNLPEFRAAQIEIRDDQIAEVKSHDHVILQCVDIVTGAMQFRLNNKHLQKPPDSQRRGKKTIAKEKLYKHILAHICEIRPHFNIGISTGLDKETANLWHHPYRHWKFVPTESEYHPERTKRGKQ